MDSGEPNSWPLKGPLSEGQKLEFKESLYLNNRKDRLAFIKEVVAFANASGGTMLIGVSDKGERIGVSESERPSWDVAKLGDLLDPFIDPDHLELGLRVLVDGLPPGKIVIAIDVPQFDSPPLVLCKDGNHEGSKSPLFRRFAVFVRHNTKAEPARRADYIKWRDELRNRILQQFQMVIQAPESAHLRMIGDEEVRDEPNFFLSRAVDLFRQRPEKLLDGDDLLYLFRHRAGLDYSIVLAPELLIHSSLRRRATLFFWLALTGIGEGAVTEVLHEALGMSDRDKSDMASAIPLVAALYLSPQDYDALIHNMAGSSYAHIAEAASEYASIDIARAAIEQRRSGSIDGVPLSELGDDELIDAASELAAEHNRAKASRRMPNLGLEYLARRRQHAPEVP